MTSNEVIQEVIDKTDMVELVGEFVSLEKSGANYRGLCPFHEENTPSFMVSPQKHLATCFGCHKSLNPIQFVQELKGLSFPEALKYVADKAGVKVDISVKRSNEPDLSKYYSMLATANSFYYKNLTETEAGEEALKYLHNRGLLDDVIEKFSIGLSPDSTDIIYQIYKKLGYLEIDMEATGLISNSGKYHDIFTRRIMFPIYDEHNNLVGFSGRVFRPADSEQPKYINSPETIVFKKRNVLFNINNAILEARRKKRFILCEGQMDVIACDRAGYGEAVCSLGTGLTDEQVKLMKRFAKEVVIMYDNDSAGIAASIKAISIIKSNGLDVSLIRLKGVKDADEMILKKGKSFLSDFIKDNVMTVNEYVFDISTSDKDFKKETVLTKSKDFLFGYLKNEASDSIVEIYLKKFADVTNVSYESIVNDFNQSANRRIRYGYTKSKGQTAISETNYSDNYKIESKYNICKRKLIGYATLSKRNAMYIDSKIDYTYFDDLRSTIWLDLIDDYYQKNEEYDQNRFAIVLSKNQAALDLFIDDINKLSASVDNIYNDDDMISCIETFVELSVKAQIADLTEKLKNETSQDGKLYMFKKILELQKRISK